MFLMTGHYYISSSEIFHQHPKTLLINNDHLPKERKVRKPALSLMVTSHLLRIMNIKSCNKRLLTLRSSRKY